MPSTRPTRQSSRTALIFPCLKNLPALKISSVPHQSLLHPFFPPSNFSISVQLLFPWRPSLPSSCRPTAAVTRRTRRPLCLGVRSGANSPAAPHPSMSRLALKCSVHPSHPALPSLLRAGSPSHIHSCQNPPSSPTQGPGCGAGMCAGLCFKVISMNSTVFAEN